MFWRHSNLPPFWFTIRTSLPWFEVSHDVGSGSGTYVTDISHIVILSMLLLWSAAGVDRKKIEFWTLVKFVKKIAFYPNQKIFSQKFVKWNVELGERKIFFWHYGHFKWTKLENISINFFVFYQISLICHSEGNWTQSRHS